MPLTFIQLGARLRIRSQQASRRLIRFVHFGQQSLDDVRVLALTVVQQDDAPERRVATQHLVGPFSGKDHFDSGVANGATEQKLRNTVAVAEYRFRVPDGVAVSIREIP
jgi:hypothetical protein